MRWADQPSVAGRADVETDLQAVTAGLETWGAEDDPIVLIVQPAGPRGADWRACAEQLADAGRRTVLARGGVESVRGFLAHSPSRPVLVCDAAEAGAVSDLLSMSGGALLSGLVLAAEDGAPIDARFGALPVLVLRRVEEDATAAEPSGDAVEVLDLAPAPGAPTLTEALVAGLVDFLERRAPREPILYQSGSDARTLRDALGCFATGVTIVTTTDAAGAPIGLTANSFTSVSLDPPLILFCLAKSSANLTRFRQAAHFAVNVLHIGQQPMSGAFARAHDDRFRGVDWETWDTGAPILPGSLASFECAADQVVDAGDHLVFIGRVTRARFEPRRDPLLYFRGRYRRLHFA